MSLRQTGTSNSKASKKRNNSRRLKYISRSELWSVYKKYWFQIRLDGDTIVIKTEPPKGEIENRIFYIYSDGELDENEFEDRL